MKQLDDELWTIADLVENTPLTEATFRWYRATGRGPKSGKLGRRVVYKKSDCLAWIEAAFGGVE